MRNDGAAVFVVQSGHSVAVECGSTLAATTTTLASTTPADVTSAAFDREPAGPQ
jgi:hypothetical protein